MALMNQKGECQEMRMALEEEACSFISSFLAILLSKKVLELDFTVSRIPGISKIQASLASILSIPAHRDFDLNDVTVPLNHRDFGFLNQRQQICR